MDDSRWAAHLAHPELPPVATPILYHHIGYHVHLLVPASCPLCSIIDLLYERATLKNWGNWLQSLFL